MAEDANPVKVSEGLQHPTTPINVVPKPDLPPPVPTESVSGPLNIVILGASFGGLSCAHHFLDYTLDKLCTTSTAPEYRLILISPSTNIYWNIAAPRAIVAPGLVRTEDAFIPIEPGFHRHRGKPFVFLQGSAMNHDPSARSITVKLLSFEAQRRAARVLQAPGNSVANRATISILDYPDVQTIPYHALLMCTGTSADSDLLSLHGPHVNTLVALEAFRERLAEARTIVICGGGCSGVEAAGQIATFLKGAKKPKKSAISTISSSVRKTFDYTLHKLREHLDLHDEHPVKKTKAKNPDPATPEATTTPPPSDPPPKRIILIVGGPRVLPRLKDDVALAAETKLRSLGVELLHNVRVASVTENLDCTGATRVELDDDGATALVADAYLACTGVRPNSSFVPAKLRDERGYVLTNPETMRVEEEGAGERVYAVGDVASYSQNYVLDVYAAVPVAMHNLLNDLLKHELYLASPYGGNEDRVAELVDSTYTQTPIESQLCPITRFGGAGMILNKTLPSLMVYLLKGHDYRVCKAKRVVVDGGNPYAVKTKYQ